MTVINELVGENKKTTLQNFGHYCIMEFAYRRKTKE
jgi:hypothetical protein